MKLIPDWQSKNLRCYFCSETRSVKYSKTIFDPALDGKPTEVCVCDKCALMKEVKTELNRDQIVKAMECCNGEGHICGKCPYGSTRIGISCRDKLIKDALTLIRELTEENERLRKLRAQIKELLEEGK